MDFRASHGLGEDINDLKMNTPLRRQGSITNIIKAVNYLCENDYVSGQTLYVDGGTFGRILKNIITSNGQIFIKDLSVKAIVGVLSEERTNKQLINLSLTLYLDTSLAAKTDHIYHAVNYLDILSKLEIL